MSLFHTGNEPTDMKVSPASIIERSCCCGHKLLGDLDRVLGLCPGEGFAGRARVESVVIPGREIEEVELPRGIEQRFEGRHRRIEPLDQSPDVVADRGPRSL